jgi:hypothetical protein
MGDWTSGLNPFGRRFGFHMGRRNFGLGSIGRDIGFLMDDRVVGLNSFGRNRNWLMKHRTFGLGSIGRDIGFLMDNWMVGLGSFGRNRSWLMNHWTSGLGPFGRNRSFLMTGWTFGLHPFGWSYSHHSNGRRRSVFPDSQLVSLRDGLFRVDSRFLTFWHNLKLLTRLKSLKNFSNHKKSVYSSNLNKYQLTIFYHLVRDSAMNFSIIKLPIRPDSSPQIKRKIQPRLKR